MTSEPSEPSAQALKSESNKGGDPLGSRNGEVDSARKAPQATFLYWGASLLSFFLLYVFVFRKTIFRGDNLSITSHIPLQDSVFSTSLPSHELACISDATPYTMLVPHQHIIKESLEHFKRFPLWNDLNACGVPEIGDLPAYMFSPFTLMYAFVNQHAYSVILSSCILLSGIGSVLLCRRLGLSPLPALLCATAYAFNPLLMKYTELEAHPFVVPWIVLAVVSLGSKGFWSSVLLGVICGITPYIMHAECAFAAVAFAYAFHFFHLLFQRQQKMGELLRAYSKSLAIAAVAGVVFAAPYLFPFLEFFKNMESYKETIPSCLFIPWYVLSLGFVHPIANGDSFFSGIFLLPLVIVGALRTSSLSKTALVMAFLGLMVVAVLFPFNLLMKIKPFSFFLPSYAEPSFLLQLCLLAAIGLESLYDRLRNKVVFCGVLFASALAPLLVSLSRINIGYWQYDASTPHISMDQAYLQTLMAFAVALIVLYVRNQFKRVDAIQRVAMLSIIGLNLNSMSCVIKLALPIMPPFKYHATDALAFLQEKKARIICVGNHILLPNTNMIFGLNDFRFSNPFMPPRYKMFMSQSGAARQGFSLFVWGAWKLGPEIDLASVKYVLVQAPDDEKIDRSRFKLVKEFDGRMRVYENLHALPPAYVSYSEISSHSPAESLDLIRSASFDAKKTVIVESPQASPSEIAGAAGTALNIQHSQVKMIVRESPEKVVVSFVALRPGVLVLTDSYFEGWSAKLDGQRAPILPVNALFRGVRVPAGEHQVVFEYESRSFDLGIKVFLLGAGLLLVGGLYVAVQRRRNLKTPV